MVQNKKIQGYSITDHINVFGISESNEWVISRVQTNFSSGM